jgi:sugar lactone lactonase YvrE
MDRRMFLGSLGSLIASTAAAGTPFARQTPATAGQAPDAARRPGPIPDNGNFPKRDARITRLFKSGDGAPNGLEASPEGLWVGEEVTERAILHDWKTGKVLHSIETEAHNTSGIAFGLGYVWMGSNGLAVQRAPRPTDRPGGALLQVDAKTGKTIKDWRIQGGQHGIEFDRTTNLLWSTLLAEHMLVVYDPQKEMKVVRKIPVHYTRAHGLAKVPGSIWVAHTGVGLIQRLDEHDGHVIEQINAPRATCGEVHGLCIHDGYLYYGDAGIDGSGKPTDSVNAGFIVRIDNTSAT